MKRSIKHLPKRTQQELNALLELVERYVPWCSMVVLFGSYARGGYVLWDEHYENGILHSYQSDYDIMLVVTERDMRKTENRVKSALEPKYEKLFAHRRHATPTFIVEQIDLLNKALERKQYFFTDVVRQGIKLYDSGEYTLTKPRELSFKEIRDCAKEEFNKCYPSAYTFLKMGKYAQSISEYVNGSFQIHQSCERFYKAISLVFTNYSPHTHKLKELCGRVKEFSRELSTVFPCGNEFEKRCYDLLCRAYIEARYNKDFAVTKEELEYMLERTAVLRNITERICTEKIASYDTIIDG